MRVVTDIYIEAVKFLSHLEGSGEKFELLYQGLDFSNTDAVAVAVEQITGEEITRAEKKTIDDSVAGIMLPEHHNLYLDALLDAEENHGEELGQLLRDIAFTFLTAWTQRYGPLFGQIKVPGSSTLIDPGLLGTPDTNN